MPSAIYGDLLQELRSLRAVDTHEHLKTESHRLEVRPGWPMLLDNYARSDVTVAGFDCSLFDTMESQDPMGLWEAVEPFFRKCEHTSCLRAVKHAAKTVYGIEEWNSRTVAELDDMVRSSHAPGVHRRMLRDVANIDFYHVNDLDHFFIRDESGLDIEEADIWSLTLSSFPYSPDPKAQLRSIGRRLGVEVTSLAALGDAMDVFFERHGRSAIAMKDQLAYNRRLDFAAQEDSTAEKSLQKIILRAELGEADKKVLSDWILIGNVRRASERGLPVKIHTGYLAGSGHMDTDRTHPRHLEPLLRMFPKAVFDIFHIGYPHEDTVVALAKHYSNVHVDMCWAWAVDWTAAKQFLKRFVTAAPHSKLFAFGGDTWWAENVVGHIEMARRGISRALGELTEEGYLSRADAFKLAGQLVRGNALEVFGRKRTAESA